MRRDPQLWQDASDLLQEEASCLDERRWQDWLDLYIDQCHYWAPAWDSDTELTSDPHNEISLMYFDHKDRLKERIWRIESGMSSSLERLPRTTHIVSGIRLRNVTENEVRLTANFHVDSFRLDEKRSDVFFGHYEYSLQRNGSALLIRNKKIVINNDVIQRQLDIFNV